MIRYLKNRLHAYIQGVIAEKMDSIAAYTASRLDTLDIASKVQLQMDLEPIIEQTVDRVQTGHTVEYDLLAEHIDAEEVAREVEVYASDVAEHLDYKRLAVALLDAVRAAC